MVRADCESGRPVRRKCLKGAKLCRPERARGSRLRMVGSLHRKETKSRYLTAKPLDSAPQVGPGLYRGPIEHLGGSFDRGKGRGLIDA